MSKSIPRFAERVGIPLRDQSRSPLPTTLWLIDDHDAITLSWGEDGEGEWPDDEEEHDDA